MLSVNPLSNTSKHLFNSSLICLSNNTKIEILLSMQALSCTCYLDRSDSIFRVVDHKYDLFSIYFSITTVWQRFNQNDQSNWIPAPPNNAFKCHMWNVHFKEFLIFPFVCFLVCSNCTQDQSWRLNCGTFL